MTMECWDDLADARVGAGDSAGGLVLWGPEEKIRLRYDQEEERALWVTFRRDGELEARKDEGETLRFLVAG